MRRFRWMRAILPLFLLGLSLLSHEVGQARCADEEAAAGERIEGRLVGIASSIRAEPGRPPALPAVSFLLQTADGPLNVDLSDATIVRDLDGAPISPTGIRPGTLLVVTGRRTSPTHMIAASITILP